MAELAEVSITLQEGVPFSETVQLRDQAGDPIAHLASASGYLADSRAGDATFLQEFGAGVCDAANAQAAFSLTAAEVTGLRPLDTAYPNDDVLTTEIGYYFWDMVQSEVDQDIQSQVAATKVFTFTGDLVEVAQPGAVITVTGGPNDGGTFTVICSSESAAVTTVVVEETVADGADSGTATISYNNRVGQGPVTYERKTVTESSP